MLGAQLVPNWDLHLGTTEGGLRSRPPNLEQKAKPLVSAVGNQTARGPVAPQETEALGQR